MDQKIPFICIVVGTVALALSFLAEWAWPAVFVPIVICGIPIVWGAIVGVAGVAAGVAVGLLVACNVGEIVRAIEGLLGVAFLPKEIYFISDMPSDPRVSDIVPVAVCSLVLSLVATLYPSWRAARTRPAEALRYE